MDVEHIWIWVSVPVAAALAAWLLVTLRENRHLAGEVRRRETTDPLTGLHNRHALMGLLDRAAQGPGDTIFAIFDLDGFKAYNDSFGHAAGDVLLRRLGQSLALAVAPQGMAFRLAGDEFCVLVPGGQDRLADVVEASLAALGEEGMGFEITASWGAIALPAEADDATAALRLADTRMRIAKGLRPSSPQRKTHDLLIHILREREPWLADHLRGVAQLAEALGRAAGMKAEELDTLVRAAELHDIGKIAIPDRILHKPGPLDAAEWDLMQRHTQIGERILAIAPAMGPVATIVRSSHERWDGGGYPDELEGEEIPLGSRIIFVCDAFEAMIETRSYRDPRSPEEALAELRRFAGTQFDPSVVELFAEHVFPRLDDDVRRHPESPLAANGV